MPTNVTLLLKGSLVLFAKKDRPLGTVAILRDPPPRHSLKIRYRLQPPGGVFGQYIPVSSIQDTLRLNVQNNAHPNITLRDEHAQINRKLPVTNQDSYKWFVNLENAELYNSSIGANSAAFKQILTFNSGELFTAPLGLSYNFLMVQKGIVSDYEDFGTVAVKIGVEFSMTESVVFTNGSSVVFDSSTFPAGTNYEIELENDAPPISRLVTDANHYYKGVGSGIPHDQRIQFASIVEVDERIIILEDLLRARLEKAIQEGNRELAAAFEKVLTSGPPAGPEAACFPAYLDRSDPP